MGNLCSRSSNPPSRGDNFSTPGRTLSSAPAPSSRAHLPPSSQQKPSYGATQTHPQPQSQSRPLGPPSTQDMGTNDPRSAAAKAAEARANAAKGKGQGKLGKELAAQRQQTRTGTLGEVSQEERRRREVEEGREVASYN